MFDENQLHFEFGAVQKFVNLVDLFKSFQTSVYLNKSASLQPRIGFSKFAKNQQEVWEKYNKPRIKENDSDGADSDSFLEEDPDASDKAKDADDDGDWAARESELQSSIKDEENELTHMAKKFHDNALREEQFSAEFKKAKMDKEARVESAHS